MNQICYRCHRFPPQIIQHAIWLYCRFTLSFRDVEGLLAEGGLEVSYETVRRWVLKFGHSYAKRLRRFRPRPDDRWHLDEMFVKISGRQVYLWRAVDAEGEVKFAIDPLRKHYLLNGIGGIGLTMETEAATTELGAPLSKPALN